MPLVLHFHGSKCDELGPPGRGAFTALSGWLVDHASAVLLLSKEEYVIWRRTCPRARFELVTNPYVPSVSRPKTRAPAAGAIIRPSTLLYVGRLVAEKGVFELLDALSIARRSQSCRLVMAGVGPAEGDVRRRISLLGLADDVELRGYVTGNELSRAYRDADIFVLPSYREGFPLVVMEAMDYGLPVVTSPIRGCADHLVPNVNALFAPPRNAEALAAVLLRLLEDAALRERMGAANRAKVVEFAPDVVIPRYAEILRSVAGGPRSMK
ncbi:MAG TPA: glycosyltransferase family 4 protein [Thermoleophilia bacterium]|nr:glycosyltransferase family 4 protein [Thermoleophilia bacterium]